jgi:hypothetical protein
MALHDGLSADAACGRWLADCRTLARLRGCTVDELSVEDRADMPSYRVYRRAMLAEFHVRLLLSRRAWVVALPPAPAPADVVATETTR